MVNFLIMMYIINSFLIDFEILITVSKLDGQTIYICKLCKEAYLTKKSRMEHQCKDSFQHNSCNCKVTEKAKTIHLNDKPKKKVSFEMYYKELISFITINNSYKQNHRQINKNELTFSKKWI